MNGVISSTDCLLNEQLMASTVYYRFWCCSQGRAHLLAINVDVIINLPAGLAFTLKFRFFLK